MIKIKNLTKCFDKNTELRFKNLQFEDGKTYAIIGPSGCGKSTLLNLMSGITRQDSGDIVYQDKNNKIDLSALPQKDKDKFRFSNIGFIFQDYKLMEDLTVMDNLELLNINSHLYSKQDFTTTLKKVGIENKKNQKVKTLSGGEKQRVAIARAIVKDSSLIFADEPTESLNESLSNTIVDLLVQLCKKENKTVIMVTHDVSLTKYFDIILNISDILIGGNN